MVMDILLWHVVQIIHAWMLLWLCGRFADNIWMFLCLVFWIVFAKIDVGILPLVGNKIAMVAGWRFWCDNGLYYLKVMIKSDMLQIIWPIDFCHSGFIILTIDFFSYFHPLFHLFSSPYFKAETVDAFGSCFLCWPDCIVN